MALLPKVKLKAMLSFPSSVIDGAGVDVTRVNGAFKLDLAFDDFAPPVTGVADAAHQNALLWNSATGAYVLAPITILGSGGAVPEAPNDGTQYGRQSLNWTPVSTGSTVPPATVAPLMDGTAAVGTTTKYAREDHIHPSDTSRAPLASPIFTGDPRSVTPAPADNDTSIATTAFVTTAISGLTSVTPYNATPVMDTGLGTPGASALYSRGDHAHPSDTTKQNADTDLTAIAALTGTGIARRTATTPTWTVGDAVSNADLAAAAIYTLKGNATSSLVPPTDIDIAALTLKASPAGGDFLILSDQAASGALKKVGIANLPGASAGISDAPNDGLQYGRQSLGWTVIPGGGASPSSALPAMDGTAAAGVATLYSRGDHVHPTDTTRAPLASPTFTGVPAAPTAAAATNTTQLATTAFVTTAIAATSPPAPSNSDPLIDAAVALPGISALYSRTDHVHPMDTELLALATVTSAADKVPMFTGSGTATTITVTAAARTVLDDTTVGAMLTTLGGQSIDAELTAIAGLTSAANQVPMFTGSGTASTITVTPIAQTVLDDTTIAAMLTTLGSVAKAGDTMTGDLAFATGKATSFNGGNNVIKEFTGGSSGQAQLGFYGNKPITTAKFVSTDGGSTGPQLALYHASPSPAINDIIGLFSFNANNSIGVEANFTTIGVVVDSITAGAESAHLVITVANGTGTLVNYTPREKLTANRTYYVRTDGNDANNGLANSAGGAFLTIQKAIDVVAASDISIFNVTIQVADGTYTNAISVNSPWLGSGSVGIIGNTTTPSNVLISVTGSLDAIYVSAGGRLGVTGVKVQTFTSGNGLHASVNGYLDIHQVDFGTCVGLHMVADRNGTLLYATGNYTISGGANAHVLCVSGGQVIFGNQTVTITGTPVFGIFVQSINSYIETNGTIFSGSATGQRYSVSLNGVISTSGSGATYFPGNVAGAAVTGGQYA